MLTTFQRIMAAARVTRTRETTYDHRDPYDLVRVLQAEVEVLRRRVQELEQLNSGMLRTIKVMSTIMEKP